MKDGLKIKGAWRVVVATGVTCLLVLLGAPLISAASGTTSTVVSLTFDNDALSQYSLGYQQALQPHGVNATFYANSGTVGRSTTLSWSQLSSLAAAGDEIGGKTVDGTSLTTLTPQQQIAEICNDWQTFNQHGLTPTSFAYPGGAFNASIEAEVQACGYGNARTAGSLSPTGATYAETLPPKNFLALRAYAPGGQITLANLESLVTGASSHGGGWIPIVIQKVCSQTLDPTNYATCTASSGWIDLGDLNTFLSWVQSAGQTGAAPAGAVFQTMRATAISTDVIPPVTTITCNGTPCASTTYTGTVTATLAATDIGTGIASTHFTTDGTTPTLSSPTYTAPFPLTASATVKFFSVDYAGNAEAVNTQTVLVQQQGPDSTPPATTISCNGGPCSTTGYTAAAPVSVTLTATDNPGGWGVAHTYYTTDGSTPTISSTVYTGPFTVAKNTTVNYFSTDLAGNAEQAHSQAIAFTTVVSLTFDDGIANQYPLAFQLALQPHHMAGTFFVNTQNIGNPAAGAMTWQELTSLNQAGSEIAGHTLNEFDMTSTTDLPTLTNEACGDRQNLVNHGFYPTSFAYPYGSYNALAESVVQSCGYTTGRAAGGIDTKGPAAGPVYAESIPPANQMAVRTLYNVPPSPGATAPPLLLANMESSITAASQNGGGWVPLVFHQICSQANDPTNYTSCIGTSWGPVELATLNSLLDWLQNAGQPGGAPLGTQVKTMGQVINGPDTQAPTTTLDCDGSPCQSTAYNGSTTISLAATDPGQSGVSTTYYTVDGSTPTTSSPVYVAPFTISSPTTIQFFSVDNAGNAEAVHTQVVTVQANADPVIGTAGDIACDPDQPAYNLGLGTSTDCQEAATANLLTGVDAVVPIGDDQYMCGGLIPFEQSYGPTWGTKKSISYPVPGDHDYMTSGGSDCPLTPGFGYQQYFSSSGGLFGSPLPSVVNTSAATGYYSYNLGTWHMIALNSGPCSDGNTAFCAAGSAQDQWLQHDLATDTSACTLAYYESPRWASNAGGGLSDHATINQLWLDLYNGGASVVLNGDEHWYERFSGLNASGAADNNYGIREFIVGTGGQGLDTPGPEQPQSQVLDATTHGVMKMTLHNGSYSWQFLNTGQSSFTDSGTASCHGKPPDTTAPTTTLSTASSPGSTGWFTAPVQTSLSANDNGGSGVAATYYTTDGSTPTTSSTVYTGPFDRVEHGHGQVLLGGQRRERRSGEVPDRPGRLGRSDDGRVVQHRRLRHRVVHGARAGLPDAHRHGWSGGGRHLLHDRRVHPHDVQHRLHRAVHRVDHHHGPVLLGGRVGQRRSGEVPDHPGRLGRPHHHRDLQRRRLLHRLVQRARAGLPVAHRHRRFRSGRHLLHHQRVHPHHLQYPLHRPLHCVDHGHGQVLLGGQRRERRSCQLPGGADRHRDPDHHDLL